jgi:YggT family protein
MNGSGTNALTYLVGTLLDLYIAAVLLRLLLQWVRADFYNPVSQFLVKVTNPIIIPLRRVIPSIWKLDTACLVTILVLEFFSVWIASSISSTPMNFGQIAIFSLMKLSASVLMTYFFLIIASVILSWVGAKMRHPAIPLVYQLTEPFLAPIRKIIPPIAGIDLSALFALIAIRFLLLLIGW